MSKLNVLNEVVITCPNCKSKDMRIISYGVVGRCSNPQFAMQIRGIECRKCGSSWYLESNVKVKLDKEYLESFFKDMFEKGYVTTYKYAGFFKGLQESQVNVEYHGPIT